MICAPSFTNGDAAFPYTANNSTDLAFPGTGDYCGTQFHWGWIEPANATGQAIWNFGGGIGSNSTCHIWVDIPDNHAGAPNAQYYIFDGSRYLANVIKDQQNMTGWYDIYDGSGFNVGPVVTLSDKDPSGSSGREIAAASVYMYCSW